MTRIEPLEVRRMMSAGAWSDTIDNPYMPLIPGMTWVYRGVSNGEQEKVRTVVLSQTKQIQGVTVTIVLDRVFIDGELQEKTYDWYAQDSAGNVWYFGEDTRELENGKVVSTEGSWQAGVNGAAPGIIMQAHPTAGDTYHQEFATGVAEDQAKVLGLHERAKTRFGTFNDCLKTKEFTPLEPDAIEQKYYVAGIGFVRSQTVRGPENEVLTLVSFVP
jgi:hypothetical protein